MSNYPFIFGAVYEFVAAPTTQARIEVARALSVRACLAEGQARSALLREVETRYGRAASLALAEAIGPAVKRVTGTHGNRTKPKGAFVAILTAAESIAEANELYAALGTRGIPAWLYDRSIHIGQSIRKQDLNALETAAYVALLVSEASLASKYVDFEMDVVHALEMGDPRERLLPVVLGGLDYKDLPAWLRAVKGVRWSDLGATGVAKAIAARAKFDKSKVGTA